MPSFISDEEFETILDKRLASLVEEAAKGVESREGVRDTERGIALHASLIDVTDLINQRIADLRSMASNQATSGSGSTSSGGGGSWVTKKVTQYAQKLQNVAHSVAKNLGSDSYSISVSYVGIVSVGLSWKT